MSPPPHEGHEAEVLDLLRARLTMGREQYGSLDVDDGRDWEREALEELLDGLIYLATRLVQLRDPRPRDTQ